VHDLLANTLTEALHLALWVAAPAVAVAFVVALLLGLVQAFTQLTEPALNAIPRTLAVLFTLGLAGLWMGQQLGAFTGKLLHALPQLVR
jgi:flagellar biosynthetic protein FliQ